MWRKECIFPKPQDLWDKSFSGCKTIQNQSEQSQEVCQKIGLINIKMFKYLNNVNKKYYFSSSIYYEFSTVSGVDQVMYHQ